MLPFRKPGAGVPLYPTMPLVGTPLILGNGAGEVVPLTLDAPVLSWVTDETDDTPAFTIDIDPDALSTDVVRVQVSAASDFGSIDQQTTTTVADIEASLGLAALADGTWYVRARMEQPENTPASNWSNTVSKTIDATAPTITSSNTVSVDENVTLSHALTANETVTWSITGGADAAAYEISGSTLRWAGNGTKNYESPDDADTNNTYVVQVTATDTVGNASNQTITTTVQDVSESVAASLTRTDGASSTSSGTTINYGTLSIGSADADRIVVVAIFGRMTGAGAVSSVYIGGNAASVVPGAVANNSNIGNVELWALAVPAGTTAAISVTFAVNVSRSAVEVYRLVTTTPTPSDTDGKDNGDVGGNSLTSKSMTVPTDGVALVAYVHPLPGNANDITWTNAVSDHTFINIGTFATFGVAKDTSAGAAQYTASIASGGSNFVALVAAVWGP
jgi:hypothetical protein